MSKDFKKGVRKRIILIQILMVVIIFLLGAKSFDIQIFQAENLTKKAENDYASHMTIKGERGQILDRKMYELATSIDAISIIACPKEIKNPDTAAEKLSRILGIDKKKLQKKLSTKEMFAWIKRRVRPDQASEIKKLDIQGIYFKDDSKRFYPNKNLAAQIIGFTGNENTGLEGLEFKYNSFLEGNTSRIRVKRDGNGRILNLDKERRIHLKGNSIVLTIDKKIQFVSEVTLEKTVKNHRAESGMALVMRPATGEILAIAHFPESNPNNFNGYDNTIFRNRAVTDVFEPGSTMKVFTAAAALEKGFVPKSIFFCENGTYKIGTFTIHDIHAHTWLSINQIVKFSSNIGAAKIAETIGDRALYNYLSDFGFGEKTKISSLGETSGRLIPYRKWSKIDRSAISFGQGISVSAIQLLSGISAIANNGKLMKPMLVKKIISNKGKTLQEYHPQAVRQVISEKNAIQIKNMMHQVVEADGTGIKAAIDGYTVCGKTGTAQKALKNKKGYSKKKYTSLFVGFAPKNNSELAVIVVIDEPKKQYYGGDVAAPAFKTIMAESFSYLNIAPENSSKKMIASRAAGDKQ